MDCAISFKCLFLSGTQIHFFVLWIQINEVNPRRRFHMQINNPAPAAFATARQSHADFSESARALDYASFFRAPEQHLLERPRWEFGSELLNPFRESRGFDEQQIHLL